MTVLVEHWLPDAAPLNSHIQWFPLSGDGYASPVGMYTFEIQADGDASGGHVRVVLHPDERYTSMPVFLEAKMYGTANQDFWIGCSCADGDSYETYGALQVRTVGATDLALAHAADLPGFLMPPAKRTDAAGEYPHIFLQTDNSNGFLYQLKGRLFCFAADAREKVPYQLFSANLPS